MRLDHSGDGVYGQVDEAWFESQVSEFHYGVRHLSPKGILEQEGVALGVRGGDSEGAFDLPC